MHLDLDQPVALAGLAAPALHIEGEASRPVAAHLGLGQLGEELADRREEAGVGRGIGAGRAADRALIDVDDLVDVLEALDAIVRAGDDPRAIEVPRQRGVQEIGDQGRFPRAGDAGHGDEHARAEPRR